jgi:hypothetical protein
MISLDPLSGGVSRVSDIRKLKEEEEKENRRMNTPEGPYQSLTISRSAARYPFPTLGRYKSCST